MVMLAVLYSLWKAADSPLRLVSRIQLDKGLMQHFRDERPAPLSEVSFFHGIILLYIGNSRYAATFPSLRREEVPFWQIPSCCA